MFRKYYKQANDDIETNRELIDKIFESENRKKTPSRRAKIYKYGTMIAAGFVIALSVSFYENITRHNEPAIVMESNEKSVEKQVENPHEQNIERKVTESTDIVGENNHVPETDVPVSNTEMSVAASLVDEKEGQAFSLERREVTEEDNPAEYRVNLDEFFEISDEESGEIADALIEKFGEADPETQHKFIFEIVGAAETENGKYYLGRWRWFVIDHSSMLCEFVLSEDFSEMFECMITDESVVTWTHDANLLK